MVITNALNDRHPDHGRGGRLVSDACFYAGLRKIESTWNGEKQEPWRPKRVFHMIQDRLLQPTFIVDITTSQEKKMQAIRCFESQFHNPGSGEPITYIATESFLNNIISRDSLNGKIIGVQYGEAYNCENIPGLDSLDDLLLPEIA
jgi:hypothetical protein